MKYCKECGAYLKDDAVYCYVCGETYNPDAPEQDPEALQDTYKRRIRARERKRRAGRRNLLLVLFVIIILTIVMLPRFVTLPSITLPSVDLQLVDTRQQEEKEQIKATEKETATERQEEQQRVAEVKSQAIEKAEEYIEKGYYKQAIDILKIVQTYNQSDLEVQTLLTKATTEYEDFVKDQVQIYLENRDWEGAMTLLERASEDLPDNAIIDQLYTTTEASESLYQ